MASIPDIDNQETQEWLDALNAVIEIEGVERAHFLIESMIDQARRSGANLPYKATTAYVNTIPTHLQQRHPGNPDMERRIRALIRWNAIMTVLRANEKSPAWEVTLRVSNQQRLYMMLASTISLGQPMINSKAILCTSKVTHLLVFMQERF